MRTFLRWAFAHRKTFIFWFFCANSATFFNTAIAENLLLASEGNCIAVKPPEKYDFPKDVLIQKSGSYCLLHDLVQVKTLGVSHGIANRGSPGFEGIIKFIGVSSAAINLQHHVVTGAPHEDTVGVTVQTWSRTGTQAEADAFPRKILIYNGKIETLGLFGYGVALMRHKKWWPENSSRSYLSMREDEPPYYVKSEWSNMLQKTLSEKILWDYLPATHYTVENMNIVSGGRGVVMTGSNNVLRNSTIEVAGSTAVYLYGPNSIVEGNTFIIHQDKADDAQLPAALKLRDAQGSIIRNNTFIVKSGSFGFGRKPALAAINLLESKDILIENNTVYDTLFLVRKDEASTTLEKSNVLK